MSKYQRPKMPYTFKLVRLFGSVLSLIIFVMIFHGLYQIYTTGISPEDIGEFFGRIANGWNKA